MSLRILTAARDTKLCTLAEVKTRLGITTLTSDTALNALIVSASRAVVTFLGGRELARQRYEQKLAGLDRLRVILQRWPVDPDSITVTVDDSALTDYLVERPHILFYEGGWNATSETTGQEGEENVVITYKAGYVLPNWIATWAVGTVKAAGAWVRPTTPTLSPLLYECTTAGTTHATTEPVWPTTAGETKTDGNVVWTARDCEELPDDIEEAVILLVSNWYQGGLDVPGNIAAERMGPLEIEYHAGTAGRDTAFPRSVEFLLEPHR